MFTPSTFRRLVTRAKALLSTPAPLSRPTVFEATLYTLTHMHKVAPGMQFQLLDSYPHPREDDIRCVKFSLAGDTYMMDCWRQPDGTIYGEW